MVYGMFESSIKIMKFKHITTALAATSLAMFSANAQDAKKEAPAPTVSEEPAEEVAPVETVTAYKVVFKGKGWGVGNKARSVLSAQEGVKDIILSGLNATVFMNDGAELNQEAVSKGLQEKGLALTSAEKVEIEKPKATYVAKVKGLGWSDTAERVRVALETNENVIVAYVNNKITLLLRTEVPLEEQALKDTLSEQKITLIKLKKIEPKAEEPKAEKPAKTPEKAVK